jgi:hypothetical protein
LQTRGVILNITIHHSDPSVDRNVKTVENSNKLASHAARCSERLRRERGNPHHSVSAKEREELNTKKLQLFLGGGGGE